MAFYVEPRLGISGRHQINRIFIFSGYTIHYTLFVYAVNIAYLTKKGCKIWSYLFFNDSICLYTKGVIRSFR